MDELNYQIQRIVKDEIQQIAFPTIVTVTKVYNNGFVDVEGDFGLLRHVQSIIEHEIGDRTIIIFEGNNYNNYIII